MAKLLRLITPWNISILSNMILLIMILITPLSREMVGPHFILFFFLTGVFGYLFQILLFQLSVRLRTKIIRMSWAVLVGVLQAVMFGLSIAYLDEMGEFPNISTFRFIFDYPHYSIKMMTERQTIFILTPIFIFIFISVFSWLWNISHGLNRKFSATKLLKVFVIALSILLFSHFFSRSEGALEFHYLNLGWGAHKLSNSLEISLKKKSIFTDPLIINRIKLPTIKPRHKKLYNILFIRLEEVSADRCSAYGYQIGTTPFIGAMLNRYPGNFFKFNHHYALSGATDVATVLLYSGLSPDQSGADFGSYPFIWSYAKSSGYDTFWILPFPLTWGNLLYKFMGPEGEINVDYLVDARSADEPIVYDESITDEAVVAHYFKYINARCKLERKQPFFGIISLKMPHANGQGVKTIGYENTRCTNCSKKLEFYDCAIYDNDFQIKRIFENLKENNLLEETVVIITSDHGADQRIRRQRLLNYYQEVLHVPMFLFIPTSLKKRFDERDSAWQKNLGLPTSHSDLTVTLIDLMGINHHPCIKKLLTGIRGQSLLKAVTNKRIFIALNTNSLRDWNPKGFAVILNGKYKFVCHDGGDELYNLTADPKEKNNIIYSDTRKTQKLKERIAEVIENNPALLRIYSYH